MRQVYFHLYNPSGVISVDTGDMGHPAVQHYRSIKQQLTPPYVNYLNPLVMMSIVVVPYS
jgi:hypothetical protein